MSKTLTIFLIIAVASASASNLQFDLQSTKYSKGSDYWTVDVPVIGGSGKYQYTCDLPSRWSQQGNSFRIPASQSTSGNGQFVVRCKCQDVNYGHVLERSLTFRPSRTGFLIEDHDYFFGQTTYTTGTKGSITGLDVLNRLSGLTRNFNQKPSQIFGQFSGSNSGSFYSGSSYSGSGSSSSGSGIQQIRHGFLSWKEVDELIKNGDISEILQLIQSVVASDADCDIKTAYLSDLLGRVLSGIEIKKESITQIKTLIQGALTQIQKLTIQIKSLKSQQNSLNIKGLKDNLNALLIQLKAAYAEFNSCTSSSTQFERQLIELQQEIVIIERKVAEITAELEVCLRELSQLNGEITQLESRLKTLKQRRQVVEEKIANFRAVIQSKTIRIEEIRERITVLQQKISSIGSQCSSLKITYEKIEIEVNGLKKIIEIAEQKYIAFEEQVSSISIQIERIQADISAYEIKLNFLSQCVQNLNSAIHEIKETINFLYYNCNDVVDVIIDDDRDDICFKFGSGDWSRYLNKAYGLTQQRAQAEFGTRTIEIKTLNIFSSDFEAKYGSRFGTQIKQKASRFDNQPSYGFDDDFSCSASNSGLTRKEGKIKNISSTHLDIEDENGQSYELLLGSCSRFEGNGSNFLPKAGQKILWKGSSSGRNYNLHSCTCY